jgi:hypothetical protein
MNKLLAAVLIVTAAAPVGVILTLFDMPVVTEQVRAAGALIVGPVIYRKMGRKK